MAAQCNTNPLESEDFDRRRVVAVFGGDPMASDAGAPRLRQVERNQTPGAEPPLPTEPFSGAQQTLRKHHGTPGSPVRMATGGTLALKNGVGVAAESRTHEQSCSPDR